MSKPKFGYNFDEIVIKKKRQGKSQEEDVNNEIVCSICQELINENNIRYVNCKLRGTKKEKIGRYKDCDKAICLECIQRCEEIRVGDTVKFKYILRKGRRGRRQSFMIVEKKGKVEQINKSSVILTDKDYEYNVKMENIQYKCNTCPYCRSHRLRRWQKNTQKFPKTKKCKYSNIL
jgi:hypothetical protein